MRRGRTRAARMLPACAIGLCVVGALELLAALLGSLPLLPGLLCVLAGQLLGAVGWLLSHGRRAG